MGSVPRNVPRGGVPCNLSHNAFHVTCMLSQQLRVNTNAAAYMVLVGLATCDWSITCWDTPPPPTTHEQND